MRGFVDTRSRGLNFASLAGVCKSSPGGRLRENFVLRRVARLAGGVEVFTKTRAESNQGDRLLQSRDAHSPRAHGAQRTRVVKFVGECLLFIQIQFLFLLAVLLSLSLQGNISLLSVFD